MDTFGDLALWIVVVVCLLKVPLYVYTWNQHRKCLNEMERMSEEIQKFRTDSKGLNTPETFVRYAKLQREIVSKEKQLKELGVKLQSIHKTQFFKAKRVLEWIFFLGMLLVYGNRVVTRLECSFGGMSRFLNPSGDALSREVGEITLVPWMLLVNAAVSAWIEATFPMNVHRVSKTHEVR